MKINPAYLRLLGSVACVSLGWFSRRSYLTEFLLARRRGVAMWLWVACSISLKGAWFSLMKYAVIVHDLSNCRKRMFFPSLCLNAMEHTVLVTVAPCWKKGITCEQAVEPTDPQVSKNDLFYCGRKAIRRGDEQKIWFLKSNFKLAAKTIVDICKARWHVELFFKWIKNWKSNHMKASARMR